MREVETKFAVDERFSLPDLLAAPPDGVHVEAVTREERQLEAVYLDSEDLRLARAGITLRHRTGGGEDGWHLKLPTGTTGAREEIQVRDPAPRAGQRTQKAQKAQKGTRRGTAARSRSARASGAGADLQPPEELLDLVRARLRGATLRPVSTLVTSRTAVLLHDREGRLLAEVVDDEVRVLDGDGDGDGDAPRFREVEAEDRGGGEDVLRAVGVVLCDAGAVPTAFTPKVVRALGPRASAPSDPPPPGKVRAKGPAGDTVTAYLRHHVRRLLDEDARVRLDAEDSVHQMRVACRRLRAGLRTFGPLVEEEWARALRAELKWLGSSLGDARDHEVLLDRMRGQVAALPPEEVRGRPLAHVEKVLGGELAASRERAVEALRTERYAALVERLVDGATEPRLTAAADGRAADVLPPLVRRAWKRLAKRAGAIVPGASPAEDYHAVRIAAKRARYAAEAVAPALGKPATRFAAKAEEVQDVLGEHQDAIVAERTLLDLAGRRGVGAAAFTLGVLYAQQVSGSAGTRADFDRLWPEVSRRRYRRWLGG